MAEEELEEDLDLGEEQEGGSNKKLIIIGGAVLLVLILVGGGAWFFLSGDDSATPETAQTEDAGGDEKSDGEEKAEEKGPAMYHSLKPVFVVNLPPGSGAKMMQIGVDVMMRSPELLQFIQSNDPMIRHQLLNLFSTQDATKLRKRSGKEKLQEEVKSAIQKIVTDQGGPGKIEAVYFTSFVMQ
jgi:flagellar FliL protein